MDSQTEVNQKAQQPEAGGGLPALVRKVLLIAAAIAVFYVLIMPSTSSWVMQQEATASGYAILVGQYPTLSNKAKGAIQERFSKGYLTRQDVTDLISVIVDEKPEGVQVNPAPDYGDAPYQSSSIFWELISDEKADYKSKALLADHLSREANAGIHDQPASSERKQLER